MDLLFSFSLVTPLTTLMTPLTTHNYSFDNISISFTIVDEVVAVDALHAANVAIY